MNAGSCVSQVVRKFLSRYHSVGNVWTVWVLIVGIHTNTKMVLAFPDRVVRVKRRRLSCRCYLFVSRLRWPVLFVRARGREKT